MIHERTRILIGDEGLKKLADARVAVIGLGGVGGAAAEALARAGVGRMTIADFDTVKESNMNRQLIALTSTLGMKKCEVAEARLRDANPALELEALGEFIGPEDYDRFDLTRFDWVLDCIDSLNPKTALIEEAWSKGVPIITSAGAGGRIDPTGIVVGDLFGVTGCPLARHLKKRLRKRGITGPVPAVHSTAPLFTPANPQPPAGETERGRARRPVGSISFVPTVFGFVMASYVVGKLLER